MAGVELGTGYVSIVPSAKGIQSGIERELAPLPGIASKVGDASGKALGDGITKGGTGVKGFVQNAEGQLGKLKATGVDALGSVGISSTALKVGGVAAIATFALESVGHFSKVAKSALDVGAATGLTVDQASRWIAVADDAGISAEALQGGLGKIVKNLDSGKWEQYGVATHDASGKVRSANDILLDGLDVLAKIPDETERARVGTELFGKGYASIAPLVGKTRSEYEKMLGAVSDGQVVTAAEAAKAEKWRLAQDALSDSFGDLMMSVGSLVASLSPLLNAAAGLIEGFAKLISQVERLGEVIEKIPEPPGWVKTGIRIAVGVATAGGSELLHKALEQSATDVEKVDLKTQGYSYALADMKRTEDEAATSLDHANEVAQFNAMRMQGIKYETDKAKAATDRYVAAADLMQREVNNDLDAIKLGWENLTGEITADRTWVSIQQSFDDLKTKHDETTKAINSNSDETRAKMLDEKAAIDDQKLAVIEYGKEVLNLPESQLTEILALIDQGEYDKAMAKLDALTVARTIWLSVQTKGNASPLFGVAKNAAGQIIITPTTGVIPGGASGLYSPRDQWAMVGEAGPELLRLPAGSQVYSHSQTLAMLANRDSLANLDVAAPQWGAPVQVIVYGAERRYVMDLARAIDNIRREGQ